MINPNAEPNKTMRAEDYPTSKDQMSSYPPAAGDHNVSGPESIHNPTEERCRSSTIMAGILQE
jgi:hypothetical protein